MEKTLKSPFPLKGEGIGSGISTVLRLFEEKNLIEGGNAGEIFSNNQGVNALCSLQSADGFKITEVTDDLMVSQYPPSSQDVTCHPGDLHGLPHIVQLSHGDLSMLRSILIQ